jgi:hypothetical protein
VVLFAIFYAKILEEHPAVADLAPGGDRAATAPHRVKRASALPAPTLSRRTKHEFARSNGTDAVSVVPALLRALGMLVLRAGPVQLGSAGARR